jgi:hypothetical protein
MLSAVEDIANLENQVIVLHPRGDVVITVKGQCRVLFPAAITHAKIDVGFLRVGNELARIPGLHIACGKNRVIAP